MTDQHTPETTFAVATLGCKVNQADSEAISIEYSCEAFCDYCGYSGVFDGDWCLFAA